MTSSLHCITSLIATLLPVATFTPSAFQLHLYCDRKCFRPQLTCPTATVIARPSISSIPLSRSSCACNRYLSAPGQETINMKESSLKSSIVSMLDGGNVNDAFLELRRQENEAQNEIAASTYHAVMEACCAGGLERKRYKHQQHGAYKGLTSISKMNTEHDRIDLAVELLQSMNNVTAHAFEIIIRAYARRGRLSDALQTLDTMEETVGSSLGGGSVKSSNIVKTAENDRSSDKDAMVPSLNVYESVLTACARASEFDKVMSLLTRMRRRGVRPNVYTYNLLLNICAQDKLARWKEALSLLSQCQREPGVDPDLVTYTTVMR